MKKRYVIAGSVLGCLVLAGVGVSWYLNDIAAFGIESGGEAAMGVTTTVDSVSLRPFAGSLTVQGLVVANPAGFETAHFVSIESVTCGFSLGALFAETVEIPVLTIRGLDLFLEQKPSGSNYDAILANMKAGEKPAGKAGAEEAPSGSKLIIRKLEIQNIVAHSDVAVAGEKLSRVDVQIDEILLTDVGDEEKGIDEAGLIATIVQATLIAVVKQGHRVLPESVVNGLGLGLQELPAVPGLVLGAGGDALELGKGVVDGVTEGVTGRVGGVVEGLFGGGSKKKAPPEKEKKK